MIAGWGVRPVGTAAPLLYVDHHADPEPVDGVVLHAGETGDRSTSLLAWRLLGRPPELAWLAAVGAVGDLGERALGALELGAAGRRTGPIDLPAWLSDVCEPPPGSGDYARGHACATSGPLAPDAFGAFAAAVLGGS